MHPPVPVERREPLSMYAMLQGTASGEQVEEREKGGGKIT